MAFRRRRFRKRRGRKGRMFHRRKVKDYALVQRSLKTYPFLLKCTYGAASGGVGIATLVSFYLNYPTFFVTGTTVSQLPQRPGYANQLFSPTNASTPIFDEYKVDWMKIELYPAVTNFDFANTVTNNYRSLIYITVDRDSVFTTNQSIQTMLNYGSIQSYPYTQKKIVRIMSNKKAGILERGWYNSSNMNPAVQLVAANTIQPVAKRGGMTIFMDSTLEAAGNILYDVNITWAVRFRNTTGTANT